MHSQSQNQHNNDPCVRYLIHLNCSISSGQPIALYRDRFNNLMLSKLSILICVLISASVVGCGGGIGEKISIDLNTPNSASGSNTNGSIESNTGQSTTEQSSTSQSGNSNNSQSNTASNNSADSEPAESKAFTGAVACTDSKEDIQNRMLLLVNAARAQARMCGTTLYPAAPALVWNNTLETTALNHSTDMATNNFFSHTGSNGLSVSDRADIAQYNWRAIGENIAAGQPTADIAVQEWLESAGHCENIMSANFRDLGVACVSDTGAQYTDYWTQVFGTRF